MNSEFSDEIPFIAADRQTLFFESNRPGGSGASWGSNGRFYSSTPSDLDCVLMASTTSSGSEILDTCFMFGPR